MAVNLPPQYHVAEERAKKAKTPEERLAALQEMWVILPKHKASEKVQAALKTKISEVSDEIEHAKSGPKKPGAASYRILKQGAGQIVFLGPPNAGKSLLLSKLTKATPTVAAYPFTTREPAPGMMETGDVRVQLVDLPPVTVDVFEPFMSDLTRSADAAALFLDLSDDDGPAATQAAIDRLKAARRLLISPTATADDDPRSHSLKTILIANKCDDDAADIRLELARESLKNDLPIHIVSALRGDGLDQLRPALYELLGVIRIYSKQPGKPVDKTDPFTVPLGASVADFAGRIHHELEEKLKSARVWGSAAFDGQTVGRDHMLRDGDVVELHE